MRALIACDKFKGSMTARAACEAVARGLGDAFEVDLCPIADGGEGFAEALVAANSGQWIELDTLDALHRPMLSRYGLFESNGVCCAVIEMAAASGILLIEEEARRPRRSSTFGTGLLMRHAIEVSGAQRLFVGIGGSATNDGGAGMAAALGVKFLDAQGKPLDPWPDDLQRLAAIDESERITLPEIIVACDVDHPLCGERGASAVFGPQKGATPDDVKFLDHVLANLVRVSGSEQQALMPGAGAAGGLGFGLLRFTSGKLVPGFELIAEALDLKSRIARADWVITGEGSLDEQSLAGKGPVGVARMAKELGIPVLGVAGRVDAAMRACGIFDVLLELAAMAPLEEAIAQAQPLTERLVRQWARSL